MILLHLANLKPKTIRTLMIAKQRPCLARTATQDALEDQIIKACITCTMV